MKRLGRTAGRLLALACLVGCLPGAASADPPEWSVNYWEYVYDGILTAAVYSGGQEIGASGDILGAFVGESCRGVAPSQEFLGSYQFMLRIYSNTASGETVTFRFYDASLDQIFAIEESLPFVPDMQYGDPSNPYPLHAVVDVGLESVPRGRSGPALVCRPAPVASDGWVILTLPAAEWINLSLFEASGRQVACLAEGAFSQGEHRIPWSGRGPSGRLARGVYYLRLMTARSRTSVRITAIE